MLKKSQGQRKRPREDRRLRRWGLVRQAPNIAYHATRLREVEGPHFGNQSSHHLLWFPKCGPWSYGAWTGAGARDGASRILVSTVTHLMSSKLNDFSSPPSDSRCDLRRLLSAKPSCFLLLPFAPSPRLLIIHAMGQPLHSQPVRLSFFKELNLFRRW